MNVTKHNYIAIFRNMVIRTVECAYFSSLAAFADLYLAVLFNQIQVTCFKGKMGMKILLKTVVTCL